MLIGKLATSRIPWLKNVFIRSFIKKYHIDLNAVLDANPAHYPTFNSFFIRHLKTTLRPIDNDPNHLVSPVDGRIMEMGQLESKQALRAKGA